MFSLMEEQSRHTFTVSRRRSFSPKGMILYFNSLCEDRYLSPICEDVYEVGEPYKESLLKKYPIPDDKDAIPLALKKSVVQLLKDNGLFDILKLKHLRIDGYEEYAYQAMAMNSIILMARLAVPGTMAKFVLYLCSSNQNAGKTMLCRTMVPEKAYKSVGCEEYFSNFSGKKTIEEHGGVSLLEINDVSSKDFRSNGRIIDNIKRRR